MRDVRWFDAGSLLRSAPFFVLIVLAAVLSYRYHALLRDQRDRVDHTYQVITQVQQTLVGMIDAETGQRGYVLTGDDRYLAPFERASREIPAALTRLRERVTDSPMQVARVDRTRSLVDAKLDELNATIVARREGGLYAARAIVVGDEGRRSMDAVRDALESMQHSELALLDERSAAARATERRLLATTVACTALSLVARIGLALAGRRGWKRGTSSK